MSTVELIAVVFGLLSVILTIRQNVWCWPAGLIQVVLFVGIFYDAKLYSDMVLHIIYIFLQFYGWYYWLYGDRGKQFLLVQKLTPNQFGWWSLAVFALTATWGSLMHYWTDASFAFADAFVMMASLAAQWLMAQKKLQSWYYWIAVDIVAIVVYRQKELNLTALLYCLFLILACIGWISWRNSYQRARIAKP